MPHGRVFEVFFESGQSLRIRLDEGFSYWESDAGYTSRFDFQAPLPKQGENIAEWRGSLVQRRKCYMTSIFSTLRIDD
ncbi:MAG: hypothetical protein HOM11_01215 [Methylococcales bacterium]|nr:hypothetical protein [Methylococcales bacterium]